MAFNKLPPASSMTKEVDAWNNLEGRDNQNQVSKANKVMIFILDLMVREESLCNIFCKG
jgi:hypothetical protein